MKENRFGNEANVNVVWPALEKNSKELKDFAAKIYLEEELSELDLRKVASTFNIIDVMNADMSVLNIKILQALANEDYIPDTKAFVENEVEELESITDKTAYSEKVDKAVGLVKRIHTRKIYEAQKAEIEKNAEIARAERAAKIKAIKESIAKFEIKAWEVLNTPLEGNAKPVAKFFTATIATGAALAIMSSAGAVIRADVNVHFAEQKAIRSLRDKYQDFAETCVLKGQSVYMVDGIPDRTGYNALKPTYENYLAMYLTYRDKRGIGTNGFGPESLHIQMDQISNAWFGMPYDAVVTRIFGCTDQYGNPDYGKFQELAESNVAMNAVLHNPIIRANDEIPEGIVYTPIINPNNQENKTEGPSLS